MVKPRTIIVAVAAVVVALGLAIVAIVTYLSPDATIAPTPSPRATVATLAPLPEANPADPGPGVVNAASPDWIARVAAATSIPATALKAYAGVTLQVAAANPRCELSWNTLAGIGWVESRHGLIHGTTLAAGARDGTVRGLRGAGAFRAAVARFGIEFDLERDDALDASHVGKAADMGDVRRLGGPGGKRAGARSDDLKDAVDGGGGAGGAVGEQFFEDNLFGGGQFRRQVGDMHERGAESTHGQSGDGEVLEKFLNAKRREGRRAGEDQHGRETGTFANPANTVKWAELFRDRRFDASFEKAVDHSGRLFEISRFPTNRVTLPHHRPDHESRLPGSGAGAASGEKAASAARRPPASVLRRPASGVRPAFSLP